jgi:hypothetical protein
MMNSPVQAGSSTACSSGYVSADDDHGTLFAYRKARDSSAFSETSSSIASPESYPDTPSGTPSPGLGLSLAGWAATYDACSSNFEGGVTDAWSSALDLSGSEVQGDAWLGSDLTATRDSVGCGSMLGGDRSILKDLLVHAEAAAAGSPSQSSSWPSRLDSPSSSLMLMGSSSTLMDCGDVDVKPFSKVFAGSSSSAASSSHTTGLSTVALFQQIFADGILEPVGSSAGDDVMSSLKIKEEPILAPSYGLSVDIANVKREPSSSSFLTKQQSSSRLTSPTATGGSSSVRNHHYGHHHPRSSSQQNSPKSHRSVNHQNKVAYIGPDRKPFIKSESCVFASQNDHTYTSKLGAGGGRNSAGGALMSQRGATSSRRWNSILEYFLLTKRTHDPQKGSNAALASEGIFTCVPERQQQAGFSDIDNGDEWQQQEPPPQLLKKLLTGKMDQGQSQTGHPQQHLHHQLHENGQHHQQQGVVFGDNFSTIETCDFDFADNLHSGSDVVDMDTLWNDSRYKVSLRTIRYL